MKEIFENAELEVIELNAEAIIVQSPDPNVERGEGGTDGDI